MRSRDSGETLLMVCCGEEIEFYVKAIQEDNRAFAFAIWKCNECFTAFWQRLAEIHPEGANGETTSLVCCDQEIECTVKAHQVGNGAIAVVMWKCEDCLTAFWQRLAEIRPERAEAVVIRLQVVGPKKATEEGEQQGRPTFRIIAGGKDQ